LPPSGLDRVRELVDDRRVRIGVLFAVAALAGFLWFRLGSTSSPSPSASPSSVAPSATVASPSSSPAPEDERGPITVHVAGAVVQPGVVRVPGGSRVVDAIDAAGGGQPDADLDRLNLAAKVVDGQRVAVARVGQPAPVEAGGSATGGLTAPTPGGVPADGPINLNTATAEQLEELPGIGPTLAAAILAERDRRGGFDDVSELQDVRGIGELRYADIKDLVAV
jgi:competence protein ComEA